MMLNEIFEKLNTWIEVRNIEATRDGFHQIKECVFKVVGQSALLEANMAIELAATADVDALCDASYEVQSQLSELLGQVGLELDPLGNEIWMPKETVYEELFIGQWVTALRANPMYVILSKAKMAVQRNKILIRQYIASNPPDEFFTFCQQYQIDLTKIVED